MPSLEQWAEQTPDALAIVSDAGVRTFRELNAVANQVAHALRQRGVARGDAVALICGNRPEFAEVLYGCQRAGVRLTPINWHLSLDEVAYITEDCEAKILIADGSTPFAASGLLESASSTRGATWIIGGDVDGCFDYRPALASEPETPVADPAPGTTMLYTSGTTGRRECTELPRPSPAAPSTSVATTKPVGTGTCAPDRCTTRPPLLFRSCCPTRSGQPSC